MIIFMKILLAGGGTMGSVSPLIAVYEKIKATWPEAQFLFIGTKTGPEKVAVEGYKIPFRAVSSGRLRRYFAWSNFVDPFKIKWGFIQGFFIILKFKPNCVMVAGGFVGVPVAWAAWLLGVPVLIHQQDIIPGLANKLMANIAKRITVSFAASLKDFKFTKTILTGNPVREEMYFCDAPKARQFLALKEDLPVLLILGGGTGAQNINQLVEKSLAELLQFCQVVHITGRGKATSATADNYYQFEFLTNAMPEALCAADIVVSRAGISTLSELVILAKPTVLIPIAGSHQVDNAGYFQKNNAVITLSETSLNSVTLTGVIKELFLDKSQRENLSRNIQKMMDRDGAEKVAKELLEIAR